MLSVDISIIIVSYNDSKYLVDCINSIYKQNIKASFEIILVDNSSTKEGYNFVRNHYKDIRAYCSKKNVGYAGGNNIGVMLAKGKYVFIINPDTVLDNDCLANLYTFALKYPAAICMPKILIYKTNYINTYGNKLCYSGISYCGDYLNKYDPSNVKENIAKRIFFPSGAAIFIAKELFDRLGGFDTQFFMYLEDTELGMRAFLQNYKSYLIGNAIIYHKYSYSKNIHKFYHFEKNRVMLLLYSYSLRTILLLLPALAFLETGLLYYFFVNRQLGLKLESYKYIIRNHRYILQMRKLNISKKLISDRYLFQILDEQIQFTEINYPLVKKILSPVHKKYFHLVSRAI